jgi:hypothetical protein
MCVMTLHFVKLRGLGWDAMGYSLLFPFEGREYPSPLGIMTLELSY